MQIKKKTLSPRCNSTKPLEWCSQLIPPVTPKDVQFVVLFFLAALLKLCDGRREEKGWGSQREPPSSCFLSDSGGSCRFSCCRIGRVGGRKQLQGVEKVHHLTRNLCQHALGQRFPRRLDWSGRKEGKILEGESEHRWIFSIMKISGMNEVTRWKVTDSMRLTVRKGISRWRRVFAEVEYKN